MKDGGLFYLFRKLLQKISDFSPPLIAEDSRESRNSRNFKNLIISKQCTGTFRIGIPVYNVYDNDIQKYARHKYSSLFMKASRIVMAAMAEAVQKKGKRGAFIVFEGIDRCGKSTQVDLLGKALNAKNIRFPDRTSAIGVMINSYLVSATNMNDQAIHLLFSANRWEAVEVCYLHN